MSLKGAPPGRPDPMQIVQCSSECVPFAKTGGLADVAGALPKALAWALPKSRSRKAAAHRIVTFLPKYRSAEDARLPLEKTPLRLRVPVGSRIEEGELWRARTGDPAPVEFYLIGHSGFFSRPGFYGDSSRDYADNDERFLFLSRAVLEGCKALGLEPDVVHAHDWQTGMVCCYLKTLYRRDPAFKKTAAIFTIHNIAYQGVFPKTTLLKAGLSWEEFTMDKLEYFDSVCFLKAGIAYADKVTTVSPRYAREIAGDPDFGRGMEGLLRRRGRDLVGILNGIDPDPLNPEEDACLAAPYSAGQKDWMERKRICKKDLQNTAHLPPNDSIPVIGMVSRLDAQKGFPRLLNILPQVLGAAPKSQWVVLGSGDPALHAALSEMSRRFFQQFSFHSGYNEPLARKIYGGADFFLMPSEFEPCGLSQMIAMRYGTVPIVTPTGGLLDTVRDWNPKDKTGHGILAAERSERALREAIFRALGTYSKTADWKRLCKNAIRQDFTWDRSAQSYLELYRQALSR